jgi:hypothetical protein
VVCSGLRSRCAGFGMNGREYNGSFDGGLSVSAVYALLAVPAMAMVPISWYLVEEPKLVAPGSATASNKVAAEGAAANETPWTLRSYCSTAGTLLKSALLFEVVCFNFFSAAVGGISTTAGAEVQRIWADVEQLPNQVPHEALRPARSDLPRAPTALQPCSHARACRARPCAHAPRC